MHVRLLIEGEVERPRAAAILLHGRGASAEDIASIVPLLEQEDILFLAPNAHGSSWYPQSFLAPGGVNDVAVHSAHALVESLLEQLAATGLPSERVALIGFSQGACLASDHAFRHPRRYGAIIALTGGLIGPPGTAFAPPRASTLAGTPVFLGANDPDPHVPWPRVVETAETLRSMGADVDLRRYPDRPHAVLKEEIEAIRPLLRTL